VTGKRRLTMEKLSARKRSAIVGDYLSGLSYSEIAAKNHVSTGTVANVVAELKAGRFPEAGEVGEQIEQLKELSLDLKRANLTPGKSALGLMVLARINECGLDPADIDRWPLILKSAGTEDEARELVRMIYSIEEVQKKTGLSLEDLDNKVHKLEKKAADLEPMSRQHEDYRKQLAELTRQRDDLANIVANLDEKYKLLNPRVKDMEKREHDLSRRIKDMETRAEKAEATLATLSKEKQRLLEVGLSLEALAEFSERVQSIAHRHDITPVGLRDRLLQELENLNEAVGLEALIQGRHLELEEQKRAAALAKQERESLKAVVDSLKQEKTSLEASIKNTREKVSGEMAKITPVAMDAINRLVEELRRGHDEALVEVCRLRDEALEVGKEVGRYEQTLQANQWLTELLALVQGDESIEGKRVRVIILLALRGAAAWLKRHSSESRTLSSLSYATDSLVRELEQWKV
jgi:DNA repair exonuclease SbcCD ATPase subunit